MDLKTRLRARMGKLECKPHQFIVPLTRSNDGQREHRIKSEWLANWP